MDYDEMPPKFVRWCKKVLKQDLDAAFFVLPKAIRDSFHKGFCEGTYERLTVFLAELDKRIAKYPADARKCCVTEHELDKIRKEFGLSKDQYEQP